MSHLYIVATPIGNMSDITYRAVDVLKQVDLIACEDTRQTKKICMHYGINTPLMIVNKHQEMQASKRILRALGEAQSVALVSDAGTPLIHDPGAALVGQAISSGFNVVPIPGPSAVITALCVSGLPSDNFAFIGFLPPKLGALKTLLTALLHESKTMVFYEAPHRLEKTVRMMLEIFGAERTVVLAREMTKLHEEFVRCDLGALHEKIIKQEVVIKGEMVILLGGKVHDMADVSCSQSELEQVLSSLLEMHSMKEAALLMHKITQIPVNALYKKCLAIRK